MSLHILVEEHYAEIIKQNAEIIEMLSEIRIGQQMKIYDNSDLKRMFHCSANTLAQWRATGEISYSQCGSKFFYTEEDLRGFLENHKVQTIKKEEQK